MLQLKKGLIIISPSYLRFKIEVNKADSLFFSKLLNLIMPYEIIRINQIL